MGKNKVVETDKPVKDFPKLMREKISGYLAYFSTHGEGVVVVGHLEGARSNNWDMTRFENIGETTITFNVGW